MKTVKPRAAKGCRYVGASLPVKAYEALRRLAFENHRSVSGEIAQAVERHLAAEGEASDGIR